MLPVPTTPRKTALVHGLTRSLINNMVEGVTKGFSKELEVNGVGYRAAKEGNKLVLNVGYSHQVIVEETDDIKIDVPTPNKVVIKGIDKQKVGQFAADVRRRDPPSRIRARASSMLTKLSAARKARQVNKGGVPK
jgi:large subunit ribosomal protein L6